MRVFKVLTILLSLLLFYSNSEAQLFRAINAHRTYTRPIYAVQADYYINANAVDDTGDALTPQTAKKYLSSVTPSAGEIVALNGTFSGDSLVVQNSGTSGNEIIYTSWYDNDKAKISAFNQVTSWTNTGGNIWESTNAVSTLSNINIVVINGVNTPMGRTPNSGYYYFQSNADNTHITSSDLVGISSLVGAEVAFNYNDWSTARCEITTHNTTTGEISFTQPEAFTIATTGLKLTIQNDPSTLDQQNEWYYNPTTKKLQIYSTSEPTNVFVPTVNRLINITSKDYITFKNIDFEGSNEGSIYMITSDYITIDSCDFNFSGKDAVYGGGFSAPGSNYLTVTNCSFNHSNNGAIGVTQYFTNANISNNIINNSGMIFGATSYIISGTNNAGRAYGISAQGSNSLFENNIIDSTGYVALRYRGDSVTVRYNYVTNWCQIHHDGGAIYTYNVSGTPYTGSLVYNNIMINDTILEEPGHDISEDAGLYADGISYGIEYYNNGVWNRYGIGATLKGHFLNAHDNNFFDVKYGVKFRNFGGVFGSITTSNNNIILRNIDDLAYISINSFNMIDSLTSDYNYIDRPYAVYTDGFTNRDSIILRDNVNYYDLVSFNTYSGNDANSSSAKTPIFSPYDMTMIYNPTSSSASVSTPTGRFVDWYEPDSTKYTGTLGAFLSKILLNSPDTVLVGKTAIGDATLGTTDVTLQKVVFSEDLTITHLNFYMTGANISYIVGVYSDNAGAPNSLLATSDAVTITSAIPTGWRSVELNTPLAVSNGTTLWLATQGDSGATQYRRSTTDTATNTRARYVSSWTGSLPSTIGSVTYSTQPVSTYSICIR